MTSQILATPSILSIASARNRVGIDQFLARDACITRNHRASSPTLEEMLVSDWRSAANSEPSAKVHGKVFRKSGGLARASCGAKPEEGPMSMSFVSHASHVSSLSFGWMSRLSHGTSGRERRLHRSMATASMLCTLIAAPAANAHMHGDAIGLPRARTATHHHTLTPSGIAYALSDIGATDCFERSADALARAARLGEFNTCSVCAADLLVRQLTTAACVDLVRWSDERLHATWKVDGRAAVALAAEALHFEQFGTTPLSQRVLAAGF
jgi:hypothetical protein